MPYANTAKKIVRKGYANYTHSVYCFTGDRHLHAESWTERDAVLTLDQDNSVTKLQTHGIALNYIDKHGKERTYTPDILFERDGTDRFSEVKPAVRANDFESKRKLIDEQLPDFVHLELFTDKDCLSKQALKNLSLIRVWRGLTPPSRNRKELLRSLFVNRDTTTLEQLFRNHGKAGLQWVEILCAIGHGIMTLDLNEELDIESEITWGQA